VENFGVIDTLEQSISLRFHTDGEAVRTGFRIKFEISGTLLVSCFFNVVGHTSRILGLRFLNSNTELVDS